MTDRDKNITQNNPTSQKSDVYGKEALTQVLSTIHFPTSKLELIRQIGSQQVEYVKGHSVKLEDLINQCHCQNDRFNSRDEVVKVMCDFLDNRAMQEKVASKKA